MAKNVHRNLSSLVSNVDILTNSNWYDITKVRYVHNATNHMFFRVDNDIEIKKINLNEIDFNYKIIVVSDYNKGFLSEEDIAFICKKHPCVFLDTKKIIGEWASSAKYIKINNFEYERSKEYITPDLDKKIIHTHGAEGCILNGQQYPVKKVNVIDVSGAGDSFLAGLVAKYLEDLNINESIMYANQCALKVVQERGVSVV